MKFVSAVDEKLVALDGTADAAAETVIVETIELSRLTGLETLLHQVIRCVVVPIAVELPTRSVPAIRAGLGDDVENAAGGVAVLGAELIGEERKFSDRFLNDRLYGTIDVNAVVVHAVDVEAVEAGTRTADGAAGTENAALLRCCTRHEDREFLYVATQRVQRKIGDNLSCEARVDLRGLRLDEVGARFDFDDDGDGTEFQNNGCFGYLV